MSAATTRDPTPSEGAFVEEVLRRLREHFLEWCAPETEGHEHHLAAFAYYEGCGRSDHCRAILGEAAPFALGRELVARHGFRWVIRGEAEDALVELADVVDGKREPATVAGLSWRERGFARHNPTRPFLMEPVALARRSAGTSGRSRVRAVSALDQVGTLRAPSRTASAASSRSDASAIFEDIT